MRKTTLYLPDELKSALQALASETGRSEAEIVRQALHELLARSQRQRPRVPLSEVGLGDPTVAERVEELMKGFGES